MPHVSPGIFPVLWMQLIHCCDALVITEILDVGVPLLELPEERCLALAEIVEVHLAQQERVASGVDQRLRRPAIMALPAAKIRKHE